MQHPVGASALFTLALAAAAVPAAAADFVIPAANATTEGTANTSLALGNGSTTQTTAQFLYGTSQLGSLTAGTVLTSIGFRLDSTAAAQSSAITYSDYQISLGGSTQTVGNLTTNFAANQAADTLAVRAGALTIPANSLARGTAPFPFYSIEFTTPYTYTGGDLLLTLRYTKTVSTIVLTDGVGVGSGIDSAGTVNGNTAVHVLNAPVVRLSTPAVAAVPEPATWAMTVMGFGTLGAAMRRRHRVTVSPA